MRTNLNFYESEWIDKSDELQKIPPDTRRLTTSG